MRGDPLWEARVIPDQLEKRLEWLDEQRRKLADALKISDQRLASLDDDLAKLSRQMQEQAVETSRLSAQVMRIGQFDEALTKHRQEVSRQLESAEERRTEKEKRLEEMRKADLRELTKQVQELRKGVSEVDKLREQVETRRQEEIRLTRTVDEFGKRIDDEVVRAEDRSRMLLSLEESRKQDSKRLAEVQAETAGQRGRVDTLRGTLDTVEDRLRRLEVRASELAAGEAERREVLSVWMDQQNLRQVEFERLWKDWGKRFESFEKLAAELTERTHAYDETFRALKQQREALDGLIERLERRIGEVGEMQRLADDRLKQEWTTFQGEDQKRWNTYKLANEEVWREHNRLHEKISVQLGEIDMRLAESLRILTSQAQTSTNGLAAILSVLSEWSADAERQRSQLRPGT